MRPRNTVLDYYESRANPSFREEIEAGAKELGEKL